jgi:hypothetical protein
MFLSYSAHTSSIQSVNLASIRCCQGGKDSYCIGLKLVRDVRREAA